MTEGESGLVKLTSKEGESFDVPRNVANMSGLVEEAFEGTEDEDEDIKEVPLPNVNANVLKKVIEFCTHYKNEEEMTAIQTPLKSSKLDDLVQPWYANFVKTDKTMLFELVSAANFMNIKPLLDLTCLAVAILIKGKSAEELREMFHISAEVPPEEQAEQENVENNVNATA